MTLRELDEGRRKLENVKEKLRVWEQSKREFHWEWQDYLSAQNHLRVWAIEGGGLQALFNRIAQLESYLDFTADGLIMDECEDFWCPECKEKVRVVCGTAYCDNCEEDEHGNWPVPMFLTSCLGKNPNAVAN